MSSPGPPYRGCQLTLAQLGVILTRVGCLSWGGGGATLAMLHSEFCVRRPVVPEEEFQVLFGLSRVVPGMNLLSLTVLLGYRSHGLAGALVALTGLTVPSFTVIVAGCYWLRGNHPGPYLAGMIRGLGPAAAALLLYTGWQICAGSLHKQGRVGRALWLALFLGAAAIALRTSLHPAWLMVAGGIIGVLLARWTRAAA